jgi:hypothetical protein
MSKKQRLGSGGGPPLVKNADSGGEHNQGNLSNLINSWVWVKNHQNFGRSTFTKRMTALSP